MTGLLLASFQRQARTANINDCISAPCQNGGMCQDGVDFYTCTCSLGYTGECCETDVDDCISAPCQNGGTCQDGINGYSCTCPLGYTGKCCETNIDECISAPCQNGGTCQDGINVYSCTCPIGYTGRQCQTDVDDCISAPCQNGGTCQDGVNVYSCTCPLGYTGECCETDIDECISAPCQNGGTCQDGVNAYSCTCPIGYTGRQCENASTVIAIEMGTRFSSVGIYKGGRVEILQDESGQLGIPSYVCFSSDGNIVVGDEARNQQMRQPERTVFATKPLIGRLWEDPVVQKHRKMVPYIIVKKNNRPFIKVTVMEEIKHYSPEQVCGIIVKSMKQRAEEYLGRNVTATVISVPTQFNNAQRQATLEVCNEAGLNRTRIIHKSTAVAIAYGLKNTVKTTALNVMDDKQEAKSTEPREDEGKNKEMPETDKSSQTLEREKTGDVDSTAGPQHILVCDLGGSMLDMSIVSVKDKVFDVLATGGDANLGGDDFTHQTTQYLVNLFYKKYGRGMEVSKLHRLQLYDEVDKAKQQLSEFEEAQVFVENFSSGMDLNERLTRQNFERINSGLTTKIKSAVDYMMKDIEDLNIEISKVILTGGSTRMPMVKQIFQQLLDGQEPIYEVENAGLVGATITSGNQNNATKFNGFELNEVTSLSLGISTKHDFMSILISRNTRLPANNTKVYRTGLDNQTDAFIEVYEGERPIAFYNNPLGEFTIYGIPPALRGKESLNVTFNIDLNGILNVSAVINSTGKSARITIEKHLNKSYVQEMLKNGENYREKDKAELERRLAIKEYEYYLYLSRNDIIVNYPLDVLYGKENADTIREVILGGIKWLDEHLTETTQVYVKKLEETERVLDGIIKFKTP